MARKLLRFIRDNALQKYGVMQVKKHGFWFVDIPRTSSTSIKYELGQKYGIAYRKRNPLEKQYSQRQAFNFHMTARKMRQVLGSKTWDRIFRGTNWDWGECVQQTTDDGYIIIGNTYSYGAGDKDVWLIKTDEYGRAKDKAVSNNMLLLRILERFPLLQRLLDVWRSFII